jgi:hypothetical protein
VQDTEEAASDELYAWRLCLRAPGTRERFLSPETMTPAEQMFFLGAPLAHVVDYERQLRTKRLTAPPYSCGRLTRLQVPGEAMPKLRAASAA